MAKSDAMENGLLNLIFKNTDFAGIGDAGGLRGSVTAGSLWFALYTADPGEVGTAPTSETAYTGYARQARARGAGFNITNNNEVRPATDVDFPKCTASPGAAITHFGVVSTAAGAGILLYKGDASPDVAMQIGTIPRLEAANTVITEG